MRKLLFNISGFFIALIYFLYLSTLGFRYKKTNFDRHWNKSGRPMIRCHWHEDILTLVYRHAFGGLCVMASHSQDGEIIASALKWLGFSVVRGSSSKGGMEALEKMLPEFKRGRGGGLALDGPRGPRRKAKNGILFLAKEMGIPVVPVVTAVKWKIRLKSWDRMVVPLPFSPSIEFNGIPIFVPKDATKEQIEEKRIELEKGFLELTKTAEQYFAKRSRVTLPSS